MYCTLYSTVLVLRICLIYNAVFIVILLFDILDFCRDVFYIEGLSHLFNFILTVPPVVQCRLHVVDNDTFTSSAVAFGAPLPSIYRKNKVLKR